MCEEDMAPPMYCLPMPMQKKLLVSMGVRVLQLYKHCMHAQLNIEIHCSFAAFCLVKLDRHKIGKRPCYYVLKGKPGIRHR